MVPKVREKQTLFEIVVGRHAGLMFADVDGDASRLKRAEGANRASNLLMNKQDRGTSCP